MTNLEKCIRSHSVFFTIEKNKAIGSGVLIKTADKYFVLTAHHVVEREFNISLGLPTPNTKFTILNKWSDPKLDIAYLELKSSEVTFLRGQGNDAFQVKRKVPTFVKSRTVNFALCGFPFVRRLKQADHVQFNLVFISIPVLEPSEWPSEILELKDPKSNFLIPYGEKYGGYFIEQNGRQIIPDDPYGLSGCALWHFDPATENSEKPIYSLMGILHGYFKPEQLLVGTLSERLVDILFDHYGFSYEK